MFMLDNWIFASTPERRSDVDSHRNNTCEAQSPLRPLAEGDFFSRMHARAALAKRQFACPAGTNSCSSIGAPDVCCGTGSTCINVNNSPGVGSVGCCPRGQTCSGSISCDTSNGYSSCPDAPNGGCCIPGFRCDGIGCKYRMIVVKSELNMRLTASRCCCGHIDNLCPGLLFSSTSTILDRHRHCTDNVCHIYVHLNIRIYLFNGLVFLCSQSWGRLLSEWSYMRYRCVLPWRLCQQHTGPLCARTAHKWLSYTICITFRRSLPNRLLCMQRLLSIWMLSSRPRLPDDGKLWTTHIHHSQYQRRRHYRSYRRRSGNYGSTTRRIVSECLVQLSR